MAQQIDVNQIVQPMGQMMVLGALNTMIKGMAVVFMGKSQEVPAYKKPSELRKVDVSKLHVSYAQVMPEGRQIIDRIERYKADLTMETQMLPRQYTLLKRIASQSDGRLSPPAFVETIESMQDLYVLQSLRYIYVSWRPA